MNVSPATPVTLRDATIDDVPVILHFIRSLAEYEKLLHEVRADEESLRRSLFGEKKRAYVVLAEVEGKPAGFALYFYNFSTFLGQPGLYVEDLFVEPAYRGSGIGKALFEHLAAIAKAEGCGRMEWWVLDWNEPAIQFYRSLGAVPMDEWTVFRLTGEALGKLADSESARDTERRNTLPAASEELRHAG
jgi:GNAT superfamily N-acetyltransferase